MKCDSCRIWLCLVLLAAPGRAETLLHDNGKWVNDAPVNTPMIGQTPGNSHRLPAPASSLSGFGDFGWPVNWLPSGTFDAAADDFTLSTRVHLTRVRLFAYEASASNTNNTLTGGYLRIWNTAPTGLRLTTNDARIVAGFIGTGPDESDKLLPIAQVNADPLAGGAGRSVWTGVYRRGGVYDTTTSRPIIALDFDVSSWPELDAGTYWLEVSLLGSTTGVEAWVLTEERKGARAKEISGGNYVDAVGSGVAQVDSLGRTNLRPEVDFAFELFGDEVPVLTCNTPFADAEGNGIGFGLGDGDVDQDDFGIFQRCFTGRGPGQPPIPAEPAYCVCFDRDSDGDIDETDLGSPGEFNSFTNCRSGPQVPANPACAAP